MPQQTDRSNPKRQARRARAFVLAAALSLIPTLPAAPAVDQATLEKYDKNLNGILDTVELAAMNDDAARTETIKLNPFDVTSEQDRGFQVMSVGSGSRLKIDMADTPVAYSVINREFIEALNIIDMVDAASWATGQTFYSTDNGGHGARVSINARGNQVDNSVSGNQGTQRNFYQNANPSSDSFAIESFDFGRGPNSALFGNTTSQTGGLAGIQSSQTKQARKNQTFTTVGFLTDQYSSIRGTIDYNRPLTDRIGLRLNLVQSDLRHYKIMDRQKTKGIAINLNIDLTPTTTLTLDASHEWNGSHNVGSGYDEYISGWDGVTVFRGPITNSMRSTTATVGETTTNGAASVFGVNPVTGAVGLTFSGEPNGVDRLGSNFYVYDPYTNTAMSYLNYPITRRADTTSRVPVWTATAPNGAYFQRASMPLQGNGSIQPSFGVGRMGMYSLQMLPQDMFTRLTRNSKFRLPDDRWQGSYDHMTRRTFSKDIQFGLSQKFSDHLFLDLGGDANRNYAITNNIDDPNSAGNGYRSVTIDIDQLKPDGSPNPNFLNPWSSSNGPDRKNTTSNYALRFNIGYANMDLGKWGNYTFNLQGNMSQEFNKSRSYQLSLKQNADRRQWGNDVLRTRVDWGNYEHAYTEPKSLSFTNVTFDATNNNPVIVSPVTINPEWVMTAWSESFSKTRYVLGQFTAKYWNNSVVLTQAVRRDNTSGTTKSSVAIGTLPTTWNNSDVVYRPDAPKDYFTMSYVPKNASTGAVIGAGRPQLAITRPTTTINGLAVNNPIFDGDRFRSDYNTPAANNYGNTYSTGVVWHTTKWFSPQLNYANSYTPQTATSLDMDGKVRLPVKSNGYDMGLSLNLFNGKLNMKFNYFKNTRLNDSVAAPVASPINSLYQANRWDDPDTTSTGRNAIGIPDLPGNDYQSTRNDGREIDISANLLRGWRLTANASWTFKVNSDRYPISKNYVPANADVFKQLLEDAGGRLDTTQKPVLAPHAPGTAVAGNTFGGPAIDQTNAINAYNNIWLNYEDVLSGRIARAPQQPTINVFNDYTIQSGRLKGLRIGAGIQWQGHVILGNYGNQTILDPNNPIPTAIDDPRVNNFDYRFMKGSYKTKFQLGYTFEKFFGNPLSATLTIDNPVNNTRRVMGDAGLGGGTGFGGVFRQPDGNLNLPNRIPSPDLISRFQDPINWSLSASYRFQGGTRGR